MKAKLLTVLNQCIYNKSIEDFNVIIELINTINDDKTEEIRINNNDTSIYISMFNKSYLMSIMFTDNNKILCSLLGDVSKTYVIDNDSYNMQYDDINALLNSDN